MNLEFYLELAKQDLRMAFAADVIIKSKPGWSEILLDGEKLGEAIIEAAGKYSSPLGLPYMDLKVEKEYLLTMLDIHPAEINKYHFDDGLSESLYEQVEEKKDHSVTPRVKATCDAITYLKDHSDFVPVGMSIGPFSLMTKLVNDPITGVFMASMGIGSQEDTHVKDIELALEISTRIIRQYIQLQIDAGAKAVVICEPAANIAYISPDTLDDSGKDVFDRYVLKYNHDINYLMEQQGVDLIMHDCGELTNEMLTKLCSLNPKILSLGSAVNLREASEVVPDDIVLFGNLPTKQFFMDDVISVDQVKQLTVDLDQKMKSTHQPFILGSECDVLHVAGHEETIIQKLDAMMIASHSDVLPDHSE